MGWHTKTTESLFLSVICIEVLMFYTKSDSILSKSMCTVPSSPTSNLASFSFQIAKLCVQCATLLSNMLYRVNGWAIPHGK
jgi:hypothetical protein